MREQIGTTTPLKRTIGRTVLLLFVVGDILGAGIYALTGKVAAQVGGAIWLPFLCAFVLAALTAASYAELVGRFPRAAGAALYANRAFRRPFLTFMVAFAVMMSGITSASAAARAFGGDYLAEFVTVPTLAAAWFFLLVITAVNFLGISESVRVNVVLTIAEATGLLVILAIGAWRSPAERAAPRGRSSCSGRARRGSRSSAPPRSPSTRCWASRTR